MLCLLIAWRLFENFAAQPCRSGKVMRIEATERLAQLPG
jgi:hypothetical protein